MVSSMVMLHLRGRFHFPSAAGGRFVRTLALFAYELLTSAERSKSLPIG